MHKSIFSTISSTKKMENTINSLAENNMLNMGGPFFIDFEAFQHGEERFVIKELCVIDKNLPLSPLYFVFKNKNHWSSLNRAQQKTYSYQSNYLHGLQWEEGESHYCQRCLWYWIKRSFPNCQDSIFYVLGEQKRNFLQIEFPKLTFVVYDNITLSSLPHIPPNIKCLFRNHDDNHCACLKCYRMYQHFMNV